MVLKILKKESNENNEPEADVDAEPSKIDFSGETISGVTQISKVLLNQIERNEGKQKTKKEVLASPTSTSHC